MRYQEYHLHFIQNILDALHPETRHQTPRHQTRQQRTPKQAITKRDFYYTANIHLKASYHPPPPPPKFSVAEATGSQLGRGSLVVTRFPISIPTTKRERVAGTRESIVFSTTFLSSTAIILTGLSTFAGLVILSDDPGGNLPGDLQL